MVVIGFEVPGQHYICTQKLQFMRVTMYTLHARAFVYTYVYIQTSYLIHVFVYTYCLYAHLTYRIVEVPLLRDAPVGSFNTSQWVPPIRVRQALGPAMLQPKGQDEVRATHGAMWFLDFCQASQICCLFCVVLLLFFCFLCLLLFRDS